MNIVNYLDGPHWTKTSPTTLGAVCSLTVSIDFDGIPIKDPHPLALAVALPDHTTGTPIYRGEIIAPGPGGATYKANITKTIKQFPDNHSISKGNVLTVTVESTSWNRGEIAPCMGTTATMKLKAI